MIVIKMLVQKNTECTNWSYDPDSEKCYTKNDDSGDPVESTNFIRGVRDCSMECEKLLSLIKFKKYIDMHG